MNELFHHGVKGMKWGERNGPPYPIDRRAKWRKDTYEKFTGNKVSTKDFHMEKAESKTRLPKGTKIGHVSTSEDFSSDPKKKSSSAFTHTKISTIKTFTRAFLPQ